MEKIITKFYSAFAQLDAETMAECYHQDVVFDLPSIAAGQNSNFSFTITGCKPTSQVTSKMEYSTQVSPIPVYTFGAVNNVVNSAFMCVANTNLTSATNQPSQTFRFFIEDF